MCALSYNFLWIFKKEKENIAIFLPFNSNVTYTDELWVIYIIKVCLDAERRVGVKAGLKNWNTLCTYTLQHEWAFERHKGGSASIRTGTSIYFLVPGVLSLTSCATFFFSLPLLSLPYAFSFHSGNQLAHRPRSFFSINTSECLSILFLVTPHRFLSSTHVILSLRLFPAGLCSLTFLQVCLFFHEIFKNYLTLPPAAFGVIHHDI